MVGIEITATPRMPIDLADIARLGKDIDGVGDVLRLVLSPMVDYLLCGYPPETVTKRHVTY